MPSASEANETLSGPSVPRATTVSADASPWPSKPRRSMLASSRSVPARSPTVTTSAPPSVRSASRSMPPMSSAIAATLRLSTHARAVGRQVDVLADVRPVEVEPVGPAVAVDRVVAVARIPLDDVGAGAQPHRVGADVAVGEVVPGAADHDLGPGGADQPVGAVAAVEREHLVVDDAAEVLDADLVVAAAGVDVDRGERAAVEQQVRRAVGADVGLEDVRRAGTQAQGDLVARAVAGEGDLAGLDAAGVGRGGLVGAERRSGRGRAGTRRPWGAVGAWMNLLRFRERGEGPAEVMVAHARDPPQH